MRIEVHYDDVPPSMNSVSSGYRGNPYVAARLKRQWEGIFAVLFMAARLPRGLTMVEASASLRFPVKRPRDEGNFRMVLEKVLGDALVKGGFISDDTPDFYRFSQLQFEDAKGPKRTTVFLDIEGPPTGGRSTSTTPGG